jgi:SAM-dependent methyltransferase
MLSSIQKKDITKLFNNISENDEFEVMFNNYRSDNLLSLIDFMNVMKYIRFRSEKDNLKLSELVSLDIKYNDFRITIEGLENINNLLGLIYQRKNNNIFSIIVSQYLDKDGYTLIQKLKNKENNIDIDNMDIRFRKCKEVVVNDADTIKMLSKLTIVDANNITFRYKQRLSLELAKNLNIDMTIIRSSNNINEMMNSPKTYELELDYSPKKIDSKILDIIFEEVEYIKKVMANSNILITNEEKKIIIDKYINLTYGGNNDSINVLYTMQPISAEVQHIIDFIPNKYSATDKSDGEKYQLFIYNGEAYLLSNNLYVKKMGIKIADMDNTIVEGELIYLDEKRIYIFMMFECLFYKNKDIRQNINLRERLKYLDNIGAKFNIKPYMPSEYSGAFNLIDIKKYYTDVITKYYSDLNKNITQVKVNEVLVYPKLFFYPSGGSPSEVFLFSELIWLNCTKNPSIKCPYVLDGIIYTALEQKYTREKKEQRYPIYKYKPPHTNSLDIYITFERNKDTGGYMDIFDNSVVKNDKIFRVVNVFVGDVVGGREQPIPFMKEENNHIIYLPLTEEQVRDIEGNIVMDNTVVEVIYTNDTTMAHQYRWQVLRTRWDKTESVIRYNKRYGNNKEVAEKVWKSMIESVTIEEISILAEPKSYEQQMKILMSRLNRKIMVSQKYQDAYYQKITDLLLKLRNFHNWIKSIIIYTYCFPTANTLGGKIVRQNVLDIGCGRGGDIQKMYHSRVGDYVGIDPDFEGLYSSIDSAVTRYQEFKKQYPDFGKMTFIQADGGILLDSESQLKVFPNLSKDNISAIDKIFTKDKQFDIINSMFAIHYLFKDNTSISNLIHNIKSFLKKDGYILLTLFDPDRIVPFFDENGKITSYYTDDEGKRTILYEIVKKYSGELTHNVGNAIDVHMSWISEEGKYLEEYMVSKDLMINTMEKAGCKLVDTDLFANVYHMNKPYFTEVIQYEENPKNKKFYQKVADFYSDLKGADKESRNWSFLFRYYVFQKIE